MKIHIYKALKRFGGFVRYYDTTEPLSELAALVSSGDCRNILACCGGGDQALTMLGAGGGKNVLWAVDINPAQLFVLAAKAVFLKQKNSMPSFEHLQQAYPGKIAALKKNICHLTQMRLCHGKTGKIISFPDVLSQKYTLIMDGEMFVAAKSGPFWQDDMSFKNKVRARLGCLRLAQMDIFDSPDHFPQGSLDMIYVSDIFWPEALAYYQAKLARLVGLLHPGGRLITYLDPGDDFLGQGVSPGRMLARQARRFRLKINKDEDRGYLVLEKTRKR